jgi:protein AaeX
MSFSEINLLGVYVAPISLLMVVAWLILVVLRRMVARLGLLRSVWHPALFVLAVYIIVLSCVVLVAAEVYSYV